VYFLVWQRGRLLVNGLKKWRVAVCTIKWDIVVQNLHNIRIYTVRHLNLYTGVLKIAQEGSIRKASEIIGISASALTRQVAALEEELGAALFDRRATGVRLSAAGEIYCRHFIEHIARLEGAKRTVSDLRGAKIGQISIIVTAELAQGFLASQIKEFRQSYPGVRIQTRHCIRDRFEPSLDRFEAELALVVQPEFSEGVDVLAQTDLPVCAINQMDTAPQLQDFLNDEVILPTEHLGLRVVMDLFAKRRRLDWTPAQEAPGFVPLPLMPDRATQFWLSDDLVPGTPYHDLNHLGRPTARVALCQRRGHSLSTAAGRFADQLVRWFDARD
jgi:DNA-binding transcriptional LysR family regulator